MLHLNLYCLVVLFQFVKPKVRHFISNSIYLVTSVTHLSNFLCLFSVNSYHCCLLLYAMFTHNDDNTPNATNQESWPRIPNVTDIDV